MAGSHDGDQLGTTTSTAATNTSFSQLLFGSDDDGANDMSNLFDYSSLNSSKMLCFGSDYQTQSQILLQPTTTSAPQTSSLTCSNNSSSVTQIAINASLNANNKFSRKRNESVDQGGDQCNKNNEPKTGVACQRSTKKTKLEGSTTSSTGHAKVRKEKLGERITALQHLVSPFGKTDTASVLHEAMGYIRFLHDQIQVLCSAYFQHLPVVEGDNIKAEEKVKDLRSRGLCLVPAECTMHVASSNGADYWSPATMGNFSSSSSTKP